MCGISGILNHHDNPDAESIVRAMNGALRHRGPDAEGCFRIFDVDLTGKASYSTSRGIPAELAEAGGDARVPGPEFRTGRTTVKLHLPGYRPEFGISKAEMYVNTLLSGQETYTAPVDQETGTAEFSFMQYGPAIGGIVIENTGSDIWLSPGEELDVYFDPRVKGWNLYNSRERDGGEDGSSLPPRLHTRLLPERPLPEGALFFDIPPLHKHGERNLRALP